MGSPGGKGWSQMLLEHLLYTSLGWEQRWDSAHGPHSSLVPQQRAGDSQIRGLGYGPATAWGLLGGFSQSQRRGAVEPLYGDRNLRQTQQHLRGLDPAPLASPLSPQGKGPPSLGD